MNSSSASLQNVLRRTVDKLAQVRSVEGETLLSPFLCSSFNLYRAEVLGTQILFAEDALNEDEGFPERLGALERALDTPVAIFLHSATTPQKRSLIAKRQGFVTAFGDMYLPQLALALEESTVRRKARGRMFTPAQQQAFIYCLLNDPPLTQEELRKITRMSAASASRALSSLADEGLIDYDIGGKTGRKRNYFVPDKPSLYRQGRKAFGDPVRAVEKIPADLTIELPDSGLSALAARSELVPPKCRAVAAGPNVDSFEVFGEFDRDELLTIQRLSYDPRPFSANGIVDPFTMIMTIEEKDERISIALREALQGYEWYMD